MWGSQLNLLSPELGEPELAPLGDPLAAAGLQHGSQFPVNPAPRPNRGTHQNKEQPKAQDLEASVAEGPDALVKQGNGVDHDAAPQNQGDVSLNADSAPNGPQTSQPDGGSPGAGPSGGKEAIAGPLQALISTVARVGIKPAAGTVVGSDANTSRQISAKPETAMPETASLQLETPNGLATALEVTPSALPAEMVSLPREGKIVAGRGRGRRRSTEIPQGNISEAAGLENAVQTTPAPSVDANIPFEAWKSVDQQELHPTAAVPGLPGSRRPRRTSSSLRDAGEHSHGQQFSV